MKIGRTRQEDIHTSLVGNNVGDLGKEREKLFDIWVATGSPAKVASASLDFCLKRFEVDFDFSALGLSCLSLMQVHSTAYGLKEVLKNDEMVTAQMTKMWSSQVPSEYIATVTQLVLKEKGNEKERVLARETVARNLFFNCIEANNPK